MFRNRAVRRCPARLRACSYVELPCNSSSQLVSCFSPLGASLATYSSPLGYSFGVSPRRRLPRDPRQNRPERNRRFCVELANIGDALFAERGHLAPVAVGNWVRGSWAKSAMRWVAGTESLTGLVDESCLCSTRAFETGFTRPGSIWDRWSGSRNCRIRTAFVAQLMGQPSRQSSFGCLRPRESWAGAAMGRAQLLTDEINAHVALRDCNSTAFATGCPPHFGRYQ